MTTMVLPPVFNAQFFGSNGLPLNAGSLYTYVSGTTTNQTTYQDQAGTTPNTNPIVLDAAGRCNLWLIPGDSYTFLLKDSGGTTVKSWDNVGGSASSTALVTSVNTRTGAVSLSAPDIPFTTGLSSTWFTGTNVASALDSIIARNSSYPASSVTIIDTGSLITSTNVEDALQEIFTKNKALIPSQSGNNGKYLKTNGTAVSWSTLATTLYAGSVPNGFQLDVLKVYFGQSASTSVPSSTTNTVTLNFPNPFSTGCLMVMPQFTYAQGSCSVGSDPASWTTSGAVLTFANNSTSSQTLKANYIAIGY